MKNISAVIINKNSQETLDQVLNKLSFVKEIIVIDDNSTDQSYLITNKYKAKVIKRALDNDFASQRNFGLKQVNYDWVLFLDSDEILTDELIQEIQNLPEDSKYSAYYFKRIDFFNNEQLYYGELANCYLARLVNKNRGHFKRPVHEVWSSPIKAAKLKSSLNHFPHPNIESFLIDINYYSTINADYFLKTGKKTNWIDIVATPCLKFLHLYVVKKGFIDGYNGFVYSFMMSFHSFLTRAKLFLLLNKNA